MIELTNDSFDKDFNLVDPKIKTKKALIIKTKLSIFFFISLDYLSIPVLEDSVYFCVFVLFSLLLLLIYHNQVKS